MYTIFDRSHTETIIKRIDRLSEHSRPKWGKMNVAQMLAHCSAFQDIAIGNTSPPRGLLGIVVGRMAKPIFFNDKPLPVNMSTIPSLLIADDKHFERERERLKQKILTFQQNGPEKCTSHPHPFFGKLTPEQWGKGIFKHLDHHLKQFGV
ncbi:DUF1569 domain-containing protein [Gracilibacillus salinarum]|uniref:DUF1569 domain-containing protein n=1 Tax=Gracilibacillus salinarum TaxID=2932255 RepID=A0ABY4GRM1_9BACI|nr:DUF1569 domain-containing protein [Gracilibacillus salinarum]UOQ86914.1 DUF1569 domain-containing protein [Gracilibacillus salinarum]